MNLDYEKFLVNFSKVSDELIDQDYHRDLVEHLVESNRSYLNPYDIYIHREYNQYHNHRYQMYCNHSMHLSIEEYFPT